MFQTREENAADLAREEAEHPRRYLTFTVEVEVTDEVALIEAARKRMVDDGHPPEDGEEITVADAVRWLLDPGMSPPGLEIQDSACE